MDNANKHITNSFEKFINYFKTLLTKGERHAFEKEMMQDPFAEEAYEGLSQLEPEEMESDIIELHGKIGKRSRKRKLISLPLFRYAAAAILLLTLGTTIFLIRQSVQKAPLLVGMAEVTDSINDVEKLFKKENDSLKKNIALQTAAENESELTKERGFITKKKATAPARVKVSPEIAVEEFEDETRSEYEMEIAEAAEADINYEAVETTIPAKEDGGISESLQGKAAGIQIRGQRSIGRSKSSASKKDISVYPYSEDVSGDYNTIRGIVTSSNDGEPLPGVTIHLKGNTQGTVSDIQGNFALNVPVDSEAVLVFSYVGFQTEELAIPDKENINLALTEDLLALEEVVVVGYGTARKTELTGATSSVRVEDINSLPKSSVIIHPRPGIKSGEFKTYIQENINYELLPEFDNTVVVKLRITVSVSGEIENITVVKSGGDAFDEEGIRLLENGPEWLPGSIDGSPVKDEATIKIKFEPK